MKITISKAQAVNLLNNLNGKIAAVQFTQKDGTTRKANIRKGVRKGVKFTMPEETRRKIAVNFVTAFDMNKNAFIRINVNSISKISAFGVEYNVI